MTNKLSVVDTVIVLLYIAGIFAVGVYAWIYQRKQTTNQASSYFLASRNVLFLAVAATLFSSNIGAEHFVGLAGSAAHSGMAVGAYEWTAPILIWIQGYFVSPIYIASNVRTTPEYLELRFNRVVRVYFSVIALLLYIFTVISSTLYAGAIILDTVLGWSLYASSITLILITGVYVVMGGLRAVVWTENIQTVILIIGGLLTMAYSLSAVGGFKGIYDQYESYPAEYQSTYMHIFRPYDDKDWPWIGIVFSIPMQSYYYWCGNQEIIQRVLSAQTALHAKYGAIFATILKIFPVFIMCVPGICAVLLFPEEFADGTPAAYDRAYPMLVLRVLPKGLIGVVVAAMLSALMSSLAAVYNSASTIITNDIYRLMFNDANTSDAKLVFIGRVSACLFVCISLAWLPIIARGQQALFEYTQAVSAYLMMPLSVVFIAAHFWDRANVYGAYCCVVVGFIVGFIRFVLYFILTDYCEQTAFCTMHFLYFGIIEFIVCVVLMVVGSLLTAKPAEDKVRGLTYFSLKALAQQQRTTNVDSVEHIASVQEIELGQPQTGGGVNSNEEKNNEQEQKFDDVPELIIQHRGRCWKFIHLDGDAKNDNLNIIANILTVSCMIALLVCFIVFG